MQDASASDPAPGFEAVEIGGAFATPNGLDSAGGQALRLPGMPGPDRAPD